MKPNLLQRLKTRLAISRRGKNQGVAILTVLAIITLMTVLVISFFNMAQTAKTTAKGSVEIQRVTTLKDTIINLVIAQFREASRLTPKTSTDPSSIITWTSQPGAIRTYSSTDTTRNRLYKLYSSNVPQIATIQPYATNGLLDDINNDNAPDWAQRPDEFTDINRPVYTAATGDRAANSTTRNNIGYSYPIVDPRSYNGRAGVANLEKNTEGFSYSALSGTLTMRGVDATRQQLAMPVRWIYLLQDGSLGFMNQNQVFQSLTGDQQATKINPIVGRLAWWADDESCKINVNTASVPAAWDTPRTTSQEDQWYAGNQPIAGEFQRYPGHPATVDLSAVFYPNRRWVPQALQNILGSTGAGGNMSYLSSKDARRIWNLAPFIVGDTDELSGSNRQVGTGGGVYPTPSASTVGQSFDDHLFTSMDEVYFKASGATSISADSARANLLSEQKDVDQSFLKTLERSSFFLTHKSHSPELTNQGFPRVSMWPTDVNAVPAIGTTGTLPENVSPYDVTMSINATIGGKTTNGTKIAGNAYFLQRLDPNSRHAEFWTNEGPRKRNTEIFKYLKELSRLPIPGYPEATKINYTPSLTEDVTGLALASKYPPGLNNQGTAMWASLYGEKSLMDSSDRTQILLNMLDYTRSINMQPAFLKEDKRYDDGYGAASGICGCGNKAGDDTNKTHQQMMFYSQNTSRSPKGSGKLYGAAEIGVIVNVAASRESADPKAPKTSNWISLYNNMSSESKDLADDVNKLGIRCIVEVGIIVSAFNPKMGWSATFPEGGVALSSIADGIRNGAKYNVYSPDNSILPITIGGRNESLRTGPILGVASGGNASRQMPKSYPNSTSNGGIIPLGGMGGPRALLFQPGAAGAPSFAMTKPYCVIAEATSAVPIALASDGVTPIRVLMMDGVTEDDIVQAIDVVLPIDFLSGVSLGINSLTKDKFDGASLKDLAPLYANGSRPFPDPRTLLRTLVVPHGDYRLTTTPSRVDADVFVPHAAASANTNSATRQFANSFLEMSSLPQNRVMKDFNNGNVISTYGSVSMINPSLCPRYIQANNVPAMSGLPFGLPLAAQMDDISKGKFLNFAGLKGAIFEASSKEPNRRATFSHGRRDGSNIVPNRGSSDPTETGDWDNGIAGLPDGPYMNYPDEGDRRSTMSQAYFAGLNFTAPKKLLQGVSAQSISPNFLIRSPVDFGSIPSGIQNRVPWQTLRFRPDAGMNNPANRMVALSAAPPEGKTFANFCGPKDHFFLDMFWMPVVEPWSISEPFSTKGTINLNQQIFPFMNIKRTTALHALLRGERMLAIPNDAAARYKSLNLSTGAPASTQDATYRQFINPTETLRQFTTRYERGQDPESFNLAFNVFRSASEICEVWLVPEPESASTPITLENVIDDTPATGFWPNHLLTGDNSRERPYANLYPRVTVRSNVFKLHMVAQTLQKATSEQPETFNSVKDSVTAEWRGSCFIERSINPRDPGLTEIDYANLNSSALDRKLTPRLDTYYTYRVTEVKQLTQ